MKRRKFISLMSGAAMWPIGTPAQQVMRMSRVGILAQDLQPHLLDTLKDEFQKLGYVEGKTLTIDVRDAGGHGARLTEMARELLDAKVDVIIAVNTPAAQAAKKATAKVPVAIMRVADPVKSGLVASLAPARRQCYRRQLYAGRSRTQGSRTIARDHA